MIRRKLAFSLGFLIVLVGCTQPAKTTETNAADASHPVPGDWAIVRFESEPENLNPLISQEASAHYTELGVNNSHPSGRAAGHVALLLAGARGLQQALSECRMAAAPPRL